MEQLYNISMVGSMRATTYVRFLAKTGLASIKLDAAGNIKRHFGIATGVFYLVFLVVASYYSYLRIKSMEGVSFNSLCFEVMMFQG